MEVLTDTLAASTAAQHDVLMSDAVEAAAAGSAGHKGTPTPLAVPEIGVHVETWHVCRCVHVKV